MGELIEVASPSDLPPGSCRQVDAAGRPVALFNVNGTIYGIHGTCTHWGGPLGEGELDSSVVTCPVYQRTRSISASALTHALVDWVWVALLAGARVP